MSEIELVDGETYLVKYDGEWMDGEYIDEYGLIFASFYQLPPDKCDEIIPLSLALRAPEMMQYLCDLTPGGSEFHNDPKRCYEFVKDNMRSVVEQVRKRKKVESENEQLKKSLIAATSVLSNLHTDKLTPEVIVEINRSNVVTLRIIEND